MLELALWLFSYLPPPCVAEVRWPGLALEPPPWAFVTVPPRPCEDRRPRVSWQYDFGVDPAAPVEPEEYAGDVYREDVP